MAHIGWAMILFSAAVIITMTAGMPDEEDELIRWLSKRPLDHILGLNAASIISISGLGFGAALVAGGA